MPVILSAQWRSTRRALARRFKRPRWGDLPTLLLLATVMGLVALLALSLMATLASAAPLSAGDRIQLTVEAGEEFSGAYQVDVQGRVQLPWAGPVALAGLEPEAAALAVSQRLVDARLVKPAYARASLQVLAWAPIEVGVSGAVFSPGAHRINQPPARDRAPDRAEELPGADLPRRRLSDALRAAGGVTPWADLAHVALRRAGQTRLFDLRGLLSGDPVYDAELRSGDEVLVPLMDAPQAALARPSPITPPGIKVYVSNLIAPAGGNAAASLNGGALSMAYGARFAQAAVAANCIGGIEGTSAGRSAVLMRTDPASGSTRTWDSPVERLLRAGDAQSNPLLLEGDAVACYDAGVTTLRDVFRTVTDILTPFYLRRSR